MSRRVDPDRPYTEEEKDFLRTRANGINLIAVNERRFAHLSEDQKEALTGRANDDAEKERRLQEEFEEEMDDEEESYHPHDIEKVSVMKIAELRTALEEEGLSASVSKKEMDSEEGHFTEKEVLAYRLLNRLDEKRNAANPN